MLMRNPLVDSLLRNLGLPVVLALFIAVLSSAPAVGGERATRDEAKALARQAAAYLQLQGSERAFPVFQDKQGPFIDRDLYVFVQDFNCTFLSHGLNPKLVGRNIWNLKNPNGRYACRDIVKLVEAEGEGWTTYVFTDPITGNPAWKSTFSIAVGDLIVMVGAYYE